MTTTAPEAPTQGSTQAPTQGSTQGSTQESTQGSSQGSMEHAEAIMSGATGIDAPLASILQSDDWQAHLRDAPEGRLFLTAHYDTGNGDILTSLARKDGTLLAVHLNVPGWPDDQHRFLVFSNGRARQVNIQECRHVILQANSGCPRTWTYPLGDGGKAVSDRHIPLDPQHTPSFAGMMAQHRWQEPRNPDGSRRCAICSASLTEQTDGSGNPERAMVQLPLRRRAHYALTEGRMAPVSDEEFYGAAPLRITQAGDPRRMRQPVRHAPRTNPEPQPTG